MRASTMGVTNVAVHKLKALLEHFSLKSEFQELSCRVEELAAMSNSFACSHSGAYAAPCGDPCVTDCATDSGRQGPDICSRLEPELSVADVLDRDEYIYIFPGRSCDQ